MTAREVVSAGQIFPICFSYQKYIFFEFLVYFSKVLGEMEQLIFDFFGLQLIVFHF